MPDCGFLTLLFPWKMGDMRHKLQEWQKTFKGKYHYKGQFTCEKEHYKTSEMF